MNDGADNSTSDLYERASSAMRRPGIPVTLIEFRDVNSIIVTEIPIQYGRSADHGRLGHVLNASAPLDRVVLPAHRDFSPTTPTAGFVATSVQETVMSNAPNPNLHLDIREKEEWDDGHLPGVIQRGLPLFSARQWQDAVRNAMKI